MKNKLDGVKTFDDLLNAKYGAKGTTEREAFHAKAEAFYLMEMLKEARQKTNITQSELAERINVQKEFISRIENGKVDVQLSTFIKILHGLGLKIGIEPV